MAAITQHIGRYQIIEELGRGGMATVYRAYDPQFQREVAVKVLPREFLHDPQFRVRFEREAKIIAALEHPAIVPVHDVGGEDGQPYLVMRYMSGGALSDRLANGPLQVGEAILILSQLAPALDRMHGQGLIHRDLKPANILFDRKGNAYLSDFGIARLIASNATLTGDGIIGTPAYMSPEQVRGKGPLDSRSDLYSLGIILYYMLAGQLPYEADTVPRLMMKHLLDPIPDILTAKPDLPPSIPEIMARALAKEPVDRYQTAAEMVSALEDATEGDAQAVRAGAVRGAFPAAKAAAGAATILHQNPSRRLPVWMWLAGGAAGIGLMAAAFLLSGFWRTAGGAPEMTAPLPTFAEGVIHAVTDTPEPGSPEPAALTGEPTLTLTPAPANDAEGRIVFASNRSGTDQIFVVNADGSDVRQLTSGSDENSDPAWSPDGTRLAFVTVESSEDWSIRVMKDDGTEAQTLRTWGYQAYRFPTWSPDGERIAVVFSAGMDLPPGYSGIYELNVQVPSIFTPLTSSNTVFNSRALEAWPDWSRDGSQIVYTLDLHEDGDENIYVIDANGSNKAQITAETSLDTQPVWSPDGTQILFVSNRDGNRELYLMNADGSEVTRLTNDPARDEQPDWSPDGGHIVFVSNRGGDNDLYLMDIDGSNVIQLTDDPADDHSPDWGDR